MIVRVTLILLANVIFAHSQDIPPSCSMSVQSKIVDRCRSLSADVSESGEFTSESLSGSGPAFQGPPVPENAKKAYEQSSRQSPLECTARLLTKVSSDCLDEAYENEDFRQALKDCKESKWIGSWSGKCNFSNPYRTFDGFCNNKEHPYWGAWSTCQERLFEPFYRGVSGLRRSVKGGQLPPPRVVSLKFSRGDNVTYDWSHLLIFFGQLIAHDITDTPVSTDGNKAITCCDVPKERRHPQCAPIRIPPKDPFYSKFKQTCMEFVRSAPCDTCSLAGKRRQINQVTAFVDASFMYGSTDDQASNVREFESGRLKTQELKEGSLLPPDEAAGDQCSKAKGEYCFLAGDRRANQHLSLAALQTLFMREHNRVAGIVKEQNPKFEDEEIFQETRKIVIAELQSIVYNEFLPVLFGEKYMDRFDLWADKGYTRYDKTVNPTILTEFNTAGYRMHSMVHYYASDFGVEGKKLRFKDTFDSVGPLYHGQLGYLLEGESLTPTQVNDKWVVEDLRNYLYKPIDANKGLDIVSANVQRGRDNGLPPYYVVLQKRTNRTINSFDDMQDYMVYESWKSLKNIYKDAKDVDLWIGLLSEEIEPSMSAGLVFGPSAAWIVAEQFWRLKAGDRFFFSHEGQFPPDFLKRLQSASFSRLLCDNAGAISMQTKAFVFPSPKESPLVHCSKIPVVL